MPAIRKSKSTGIHIHICLLFGLLSLLVPAMSKAAGQTQPAFDVAAIRPSSGDVKFERNGKTEAAHGMLRMRDITVSTCIQWAYGVSQGQIQGPDSLTHVHYDITAKTDPDATEKQMRVMMRALLSDRFQACIPRGEEGASRLQPRGRERRREDASVRTGRNDVPRK